MSEALQTDDVPSDDPVVAEAKRRFRRCTEWESPSRERFLNDYRFAEGDSDNNYQWPNAQRRTRDVDNRPCLTLNIVRQHNLQVINDIRQNKYQIKIRPQGNGATVDSAEMFGNVIRAIEYKSKAQTAYLMAAEFQIKGGIGWWRIATDYADDESFDQEIFIRQVRDPLSIYMDPDCQELDCSDAKFAFVFDNIPTEEFDDAYPEYREFASLSPLGSGTSDDDWITTDHVRVCEYFRVVDKPGRIISFVDPATGKRKTARSSKLPKAVLEAVIDDPLTKMRTISGREVEWKLIVGNRVVEEGIWPGKYIPLIRVLGEQTIIDGVMDRKGHTRAMKDAQRMFNYNAALSIDTKIPTPTGWTTMGRVKDGDLIFDHNGQVVEVKKALPVRHGEPCFRVTFDNGYSVITDAGHIWAVEERAGRTSAGYVWKNKTVSTAELTSKKHFIPLANALELSHADLPIDPYVLGLWLGDGHSSSAAISAHKDDVEEEKELIQACGYTTGDIRSEIGNGVVFNVFGLRQQLRELGVAYEKHIPNQYLRASYSQRLSLLQGLMDSDGHIAPANNQCAFVNGNVHIVRGFMELCASLGIKATINKQPEIASTFPNGKEYISAATYRVQFTAGEDTPVFRLERKRALQTKERNQHWCRTKRIGIKSVEPVKSVPVRCIMLDTPEHLYLCGDGMIPTHNSSQVEFVALQGKTPWVAAVKAIEEYESYWNTANTKNYSVLPYNNRDDDGNEIAAPTRQEPPVAAPAFQLGMDTAFNQMMMTSGQWQNQMGMMGNERTGAAIRARQGQGDTATFHFIDNFQAALACTGMHLLDLIPKVYDTKRVLRMQGDDGVDFDVEIDPTQRQAYLEERAYQGNVVRKIFNPTIGSYGVEASSGAAYGSKREETVQALSMIITQAPGVAQIIGDLLLSSMDFPDAQEAARRLRRMVPPQALGTGPSQAEQVLMQQTESLKLALAEALQDAAEKNLKLKGRDQLRDIDIYKAETDRMGKLADALPTDLAGLQALVMQLVNDALSTSLKPILEVNRAGIVEQSGSDLDDVATQLPEGM